MTDDLKINQLTNVAAMSALLYCSLFVKIIFYYSFFYSLHFNFIVCFALVANKDQRNNT